MTPPRISSSQCRSLLLNNRALGRLCLCLLGLCLAGSVVGCHGDTLSTTDLGTAPPHAGSLITLPGGRGFIEVVKKEGQAPITSEVAFYFYRDSVYTPLDSIPETGELVMDGKRKVSLISDGEGALVTPTGPVLFGKRDVEGMLIVEVDGETRQIPIGIR